MNTLELIKEAKEQTSSAINLIASESWMSSELKIPYITDIFHRYSFEEKEGTLSKSLPQFFGRDKLNELEEKCNGYLKEIMNVKYSSVKPISGLNMMISAIGCFTKKNDRIMSVPPEYGGHSATKFIAERIGLIHEFLPFKEGTFEIDCTKLSEYIEKNKIKIIYIDMMNVTFPFNIRELRECVGKNVVICYDASHVLGLIMGNQFQDPFKEGVDVVIGSTHKSLPGPHKGVILTNNKWYFMLYELMNDMYISHHHIADVAVLSLVLEKMNKNINEYAKKVVYNAQLLARTLKENNIDVFNNNGEFTMSHQVWIKVPEENLGIVSESLARYGIIVNTITIPVIMKQGIRIGVQEITEKNFNEDDVVTLGKIIAEIIQNNNLSESNEDKLQKLRIKIIKLEKDGVKKLITNLNELYEI